MNVTQKQLKQTCVAIDAHVHLHSIFDLSVLLDNAAANFESAARQSRQPGPVMGCMLLTESDHIFRFEELASLSDSNTPLGDWTIQSTPDVTTLLARHTEKIPLIIVAGRQIQTRERLEVLAFGCLDHFGENEPMRDVVRVAQQRCWLAAIPWGFGKWTGYRKTLLEELIHSPLGKNIYLGDNGGRLRWVKPPPLLSFNANGGIPVLPGTDPFPLKSHVSRAGSYGFFVRGNLESQNPGQAIRKLLTEERRQPSVYGTRVGLARFVVDQAGIRIARCLRKSL